MKSDTLGRVIRRTRAAAGGGLSGLAVLLAAPAMAAPARVFFVPPGADAVRLLADARPAALFAPYPDPVRGPILPLRTLRPLAARLHLPVIDGFREDGVNALAREILTDPSLRGYPVAVCWTASSGQRLLSALGWSGAADRPLPNRADRVMVLDFDAAGSPVALRPLPAKAAAR